MILFHDQRPWPVAKYRTRQLTFLLDSGASEHLVNRDDLFDTYTTLQQPLNMSVAKTGAFITTTKRGNIKVTTNKGINGVLENVLFCRDVPYNLLSVQRLTQAGMTTSFTPRGVTVYKNGKTIMQGKPINGLLGLEFTVKRNVKNYEAQINATTNNNNNYQLWHMRLSHININSWN